MDQDVEEQILEYLEELEDLDNFLDENSQSSESDYADVFLDRVIPIFDWTNQYSIERTKKGISWGSWARKGENCVMVTQSVTRER